mgnify:FL=1
MKMMEQEEAFAGYAEQIIFVVRSKEALETPTLSKALAKLKIFRFIMMISQRLSILWEDACM